MLSFSSNLRENSLITWLPILTLSLCVFVFNSSEFIPIGLLSDIGNDFNLTEAQTGWLVTTYAWVVAGLSLPLMLLASRIEYQKLMVGVLSLFVICHLISFISPQFWVLMVSRIGVACSHAIFWSIVCPLAVEVVPPKKRSFAISMIVVGSSLAMIVGLPLGRFLGLYLGWRITFLCIGFVALLALICLLCFFPKIRTKNAIALHEVPTLLSKPILISIYLLTPTIMTGNFTVYSYIEPFLSQVYDIPNNLITLILLAYGAIGLLSSWLFSKFYDFHPFTFIKTAVFGIPLTLLCFNIGYANIVTISVLCTCWGFFVTLYNLVFQSLILLATPKGSAIAMSVYSATYNIGIGCGALTGGIVCAELSIKDISYIGGSIAIFGAIFCFICLIPQLQALMKLKFH